MERRSESGGAAAAAVATAQSKEALVSVCAVLTDDIAALDSFIDEVTRMLADSFRYYELLLIDNAADPGVGEAVQVWQHRVPNVRMLRLSRRYGTEIALAAALDNSIGDYVVVAEIAADPVWMIKSMVETAISGHDVVIAESDRSGEPILRKWLIYLFCRMASVLLGYTLRPNATYFRVFSRKAVNSLVRIRSKNRYLRCLNGMVGFSQASIPYRRLSTGKRSKRGFLGSAGAAVDIIISNSAAPLRLASLLGLGASIANVLYFGYILVVTLVKRRLAEGWLTTSLTSTTMFFFLFVILTILSEYVARILDEAKDQPLYFVESELNSDVASFGNNRLNIV